MRMARSLVHHRLKYQIGLSHGAMCGLLFFPEVFRYLRGQSRTL